MILVTDFSLPGMGLEEKINGISRTDGDLTVHIVGHTGQGCHTFALASGGDDHLLLIGIILHLIQIHQCFSGILMHSSLMAVSRIFTILRPSTATLRPNL